MFEEGKLEAVESIDGEAAAMPSARRCGKG